MRNSAWSILVATFATCTGCGGEDCCGGGGGGETGGWASGGTTGDAGSAPGGAAGVSTSCAPLPPPNGDPILVTPSQTSELPRIVDEAPAGATILLEPGTYELTRWLDFSRDGMTLRSTTDQAADVILDATYSVNEAVVIRANAVTIAHLTILRAIDHPVHVYPPDAATNIQGPRLYGLRLIDGGEQFVKVNPMGDPPSAFVDNGSVECSSFQLTDEGRPNVERTAGGCYTGGIDVHAARGWLVRNNHFEGIYCETEGLAEHAVHFWRGCRDTVVENNTIQNCARGIGFGMGDGEASSRVYPDRPYEGASLGHYDGIIRNNVIHANIDFVSGYDSGITLEQARHPLILHNTVVSTRPGSFFSSIDYRFSGTEALIRNNLVDRITVRDGAAGTVDHNLEDAPHETFVEFGRDFHLSSAATAAIDQGLVESASGLDMDGQAHDQGAPDLGADERSF